MSSSTKRVANPRKKSVAHKKTESVHIRSTVRRPWKTVDFVFITQHILGPAYELSIVLIGDSKARTLNTIYRKKKTPANVLSFPLTDTHGEIFLNLARIRREAASYELTPNQHARYLLIHGCLHLRGYDHGSTMERAEQKLLKRFVLR